VFKIINHSISFLNLKTEEISTNAQQKSHDPAFPSPFYPLQLMGTFKLIWETL